MFFFQQVYRNQAAAAAAAAAIAAQRQGQSGNGQAGNGQANMALLQQQQQQMLAQQHLAGINNKSFINDFQNEQTIAINNMAQQITWYNEMISKSSYNKIK